MCVFRPVAPPQEGHQSTDIAEKRNRKQWQVREDVGMVLERVVIMDTFLHSQSRWGDVNR